MHKLFFLSFLYLSSKNGDSGGIGTFPGKPGVSEDVFWNLLGHSWGHLKKMGAFCPQAHPLECRLAPFLPFLPAHYAFLPRSFLCPFWRNLSPWLQSYVGTIAPSRLGIWRTANSAGKAPWRGL